MKEIIKYLKNYILQTIMAPLFKMLEAIFELFVPLAMAKVIDVGIANHDQDYVIKMSLVLVALAFIGVVCSVTAQYFAAKAATGFATELRHDVFQRLTSLSYKEYDHLGTSTMITRMTSDINQTQNGVNMVLRLFLRSPFIVFGAMIMAFTVNVKAALIFVVAIPCLAAVVFAIILKNIPMYKNVQKGVDGVMLSTRENLSGARVIRAFAKEEQEKKEFAEKNNALTNLQLHAGRVAALLNPATYIIINIAIVAILWVGAKQVNTGSLTTGQVVALVNYMTQILVELVKLANLIVTMTKSIACGNRIAQILQMQPSMVEGSITKGQPTDEVVRFEHVSLSYNESGDEALTDISFSVKRGQTIGIIGGTGSGKSSVIHLIPRFYDATKGNVLVDGVNVNEYTYESLRMKIGFALQKPILFSGTIADNLRWGKENASDDDVRLALKQAQAESFVMEKNKDIQYQLEQNASNLSGGQKQRLAIARALIRKPEILILDDSTSALDYATDAALRKAIKELDYDPTVFIVSQRASSLIYADQIIVMEDGEIAGMGTHDYLLRNCQVYQEIYESQARLAGKEQR